MYASLPTPTPPATVNAPVVVDVEFVIFVTVDTPPITNPPAMPTPPATCKAPVVGDRVALVPVITIVVNVALPATTGVDTPVKLTLPVTLTSPNTFKLPPMPTPPATTNAPVEELLEPVVLVNIKPPVLIVPYTPPANVDVPSSVPLEYHSKYLVSLANTNPAFWSAPL